MAAVTQFTSHFVAPETRNKSANQLIYLRNKKVVHLSKFKVGFVHLIYLSSRVFSSMVSSTNDCNDV